MQTKLLTFAIVSGLAAGLFALAPAASAAATTPPTTAPQTTTQQTPTQTTTPQSSSAEMRPNDTINCQMDFTLSGWSAIYKTSSGHGMVTCSNGKTMKVHLSAKGAGLSAGAYKLNDGHGTFTNITNINQVLGTYVKGTAHVGVTKSTRAAVLTKNNVSLALTGTGNGWNIGVAITGFTITRASAASAND